MKISTRITLLLFLLLLLIIVCIWCHADKIVEKRALIALEMSLKPTVKDVEKTSSSNKLMDNLNSTSPLPNIAPIETVAVEDVIINDDNLSSFEPIFYTIRKVNNQLTVEGTLSSEKQEKLLLLAINSTPLVKAININPKLLPNDKAFSFTLELLKIFNSDYSEGFIRYQDGAFTVGGTVANEAVKKKMSALLQTHSDDFNNYTKVKLSSEVLKAKKEALIEQNRQKREQEAEEEFENNKRIDELLRVEKEEEALKKAIKIEASKRKEAKLFEAGIKVIIDSEKIRFESSKSILTTKSKKTIEKIAKLLKEHSDVNIEILGHTDSSGDSKLNLHLSQNRVNAVKNLLREYHINANRLKAVGYGSTQPLVSNDTKENRQINRRVEFKIIGE